MGFRVEDFRSSKLAPGANMAPSWKPMWRVVLFWSAHRDDDFRNLPKITVRKTVLIHGLKRSGNARQKPPRGHKGFEELLPPLRSTLCFERCMRLGALGEV